MILCVDCFRILQVPYYLPPLPLHQKWVLSIPLPFKYNGNVFCGFIFYEMGFTSVQKRLNFSIKSSKTINILPVFSKPKWNPQYTMLKWNVTATETTDLGFVCFVVLSLSWFWAFFCLITIPNPPPPHVLPPYYFTLEWWDAVNPQATGLGFVCFCCYQPLCLVSQQSWFGLFVSYFSSPYYWFDAPKITPPGLDNQRGSWASLKEPAENRRLEKN